MTWTSPSASFLTVTSPPVVERRSIVLFARVFPAPNEIVVATGRVASDG